MGIKGWRVVDLLYDTVSTREVELFRDGKYHF